jgi:hypothetical protein
MFLTQIDGPYKTRCNTFWFQKDTTFGLVSLTRMQAISYVWGLYFLLERIEYR